MSGAKKASKSCLLAIAQYAISRKWAIEITIAHTKFGKKRWNMFISKQRSTPSSKVAIA